MLPQFNDDLRQDFKLAERQTSNTYKMYLEKQRVRDYIDKIEAVKQAIYKILNTERYHYVIYSWNYGVELADLIGQPIPYVYSKIKERISDALLQDDRILSVRDFYFDRKDGAVQVTFTVETIYGAIEAGKEVRI